MFVVFVAAACVAAAAAAAAASATTTATALHGFGNPSGQGKPNIANLVQASTPCHVYVAAQVS